MTRKDNLHVVMPYTTVEDGILSSSILLQFKYAIVYFLNSQTCIGSIGDSGGEKNYWLSRD